MDWIFKEHKGREKVLGNASKRGLHLAKKADAKVKLCPKCNLCFEYDYLSKNWRFYENFPTYGKIREHCPKCQE